MRRARCASPNVPKVTSDASDALVSVCCTALGDSGAGPFDVISASQVWPYRLGVVSCRRFAPNTSAAEIAAAAATRPNSDDAVDAVVLLRVRWNASRAPCTRLTGALARASVVAIRDGRGAPVALVALIARVTRGAAAAMI